MERSAFSDFPNLVFSFLHTYIYKDIYKAPFDQKDTKCKEENGKSEEKKTRAKKKGKPTN